MLEAHNLSKVYKGRQVLHNVSLALQPGQCLGIAGHNGSGKSTLMAIIAQVIPPSTGQIYHNGQNILGNRQFLRTMLGYTPQQNCLLEDLTVLETLHFWQKTYGLSGQDLFAPGTPCNILGLQGLAKKKVGALSGGMQKRVSIALSIMHRPQYLLLDEVLSSLDRFYRAALFEWLGAFRAAGGAILYCSHEPAELTSFCNTILVLRQGQTIFYDSVDNFPTTQQDLDSMLNPPVILPA